MFNTYKNQKASKTVQFLRKLDKRQNWGQICVKSSQFSNSFVVVMYWTFIQIQFQEHCWTVHLIFPEKWATELFHYEFHPMIGIDDLLNFSISVELCDLWSSGKCKCFQFQCPRCIFSSLFPTYFEPFNSTESPKCIFSRAQNIPKMNCPTWKNYERTLSSTNFVNIIKDLSLILSM